MIIIWIIVAILMFSIIILIHEWWHFTAARKFWVRVEEFGLWIPPRAKKLFKDKKWTLFSLNRLPLWGFVKLTGESPNTFLVYDKDWILYNNEKLEKDIKNNLDIYYKSGEKVEKEKIEKIQEKLKENKSSHNLMNKKTRQQAIIILAWIFMNFLLAIVIFSVLFFIWVKPVWVNTKIDTELDLKLIPTYEQAIESWFLIKNPWIILNPLEWSIADKAWIWAWDILKNINWENINSPQEMINIISNNKNKEIKILLFEKTDCVEPSTCLSYITKEIKIKIPETWKIWSYVSENIEINKDFEYKYSAIESIKYWTLETYNQIFLTFKAIWILIKKVFNPETPEERQEAIDSMSWPIWIVDFVSNSISAWIVFILIIWAVISINLWVFNLLPIPALDWWRFIFITINWLIKRIFWRKAISEKTEAIIHFGFFVFLIALSLLIAYNDINKIISR